MTATIQPTAAPRTAAPSAGATLYLVAPPSVRSWFEHFLDRRPGDRVLHVGEGSRLDLLPVLQAIDGDACSRAVVISSHASLARDARLTEALRCLGIAAVGPTKPAARLGTDKFAMKRFFDRHGFATPAWAPATAANLPGDPGDPGDVVVVKRRCSTQSDGTRLQELGAAPLAADELAEAYTDGVEYSVVVYRDQQRELVFPPIWKGRTSPSLVPPWKRLRLCPDPLLAADREAELRASARAIARAADVCGHLEVEYLLTRDGALQVLEINPRIAGTMRLAALATATPLFSLHRHSAVHADLQASAFAGEVPYRGPSWSDPAAGVFATSRLTVAGPTLADVRGKLERALRHGRLVIPPLKPSRPLERAPRRPAPAGRTPVAVGA